MQHPVILFDGLCNLCNASVDFILRWDRRGYFRFASLQSPAGQSLLEPCPERAGASNSVLLVADKECFTRSTAALQIARRLSFPWPALFVLILIPPVLRDAGYDLVARNRYRWFGIRATCRLPTPDERARFLE